MANTGATDHMFPDRSAFISYRKSAKSCVHLGNISHTPILGEGTAIVALNGKAVLVRNALYVPGLHLTMILVICFYFKNTTCRIQNTLKTRK